MADYTDFPAIYKAYEGIVTTIDEGAGAFDKDGNPVNFGDMSMDQFLQAREHIDNDNIEKILEM